jgi:hypothetical protein
MVIVCASATAKEVIMASFGFSWGGAVITLTHEEVQTLATAEDVASAALGLGIAVPSPFQVAFGVVLAYIQLNKAVMLAVDQGNGVYLTVPWPAIWWGQWWLVIPTPV